jgi:hypothetical protein
MQTRARARAGEYHLALGPPTTDATRATKASIQTRASLLKATAGVYFLAMQTRACPWRARAWGIHLGRWPSDTGRQGNHADKCKLVEGECKGGEPEHKPKAKGRAQWQPESGQKTLAEQASESDTSGTSESKSQDKEEEKENDNMSANRTRRANQQARRRKAYALGQVPKVIHKGHNVPFTHRFCRKSPKEMRKNVAGTVYK